MNIVKGEKYIAEFDPSRRLVREKAVGTYEGKDIIEIHKIYEEYIGKLFNQDGIKPWAKISDLREYKTSMIVEEMNAYAEWASENGLVYAVNVVSKLIDGMQMKRGAKGVDLNIIIFDNMEDAEEWLKSKGF